MFLGIRLYCRCVSVGRPASAAPLLLHGLGLLIGRPRSLNCHWLCGVGSRLLMRISDFPAGMSASAGANLSLSGSRRSFMMEYDVHTVLDLLTLAATAWVIYTLRVTLKDSYQNEQDTIQTYYVVRCGARCVRTQSRPYRSLHGHQ